MPVRKPSFPPIAMIGAALGALAIATGAFGAHALKPFLTEQGMGSAWETAVLFNLLHAVAISALGWTFGPVPWSNRSGLVGLAWILGTSLFSGSLYLLALGGPRWLGPITPLGGLLLLIGWLLAIFLRPDRSVRPD